MGLAAALCQRHIEASIARLSMCYRRLGLIVATNEIPPSLPQLFLSDDNQALIPPIKHKNSIV